MTVVQEQVNKSIIIADDDELLREKIVEILVEVGYSVRAASTGAEAQEQYEAEPADLVITNIFMPDMDGIELVRAFFNSGENIRLMAMSGHVGDVDYLEIANALGADTPKAVSENGLSEHSRELLIATATLSGGYLARRLS